MKKKAFTLIELVITMVLSGILVIAMTCQFVTLSSFTRKVGRGLGNMTGISEPTAVREARIVTHHMQRVLRFAKPNFFITSLPNGYCRIMFILEGGHFDPVQTDLGAYYVFIKTQQDGSYAPGLYYYINGVTTLLSNAVASFSATWDSNTKMLNLKLNFTDSQITVPVETSVRVLGDT